MKTVQEYLSDNNICAESALLFTSNDYDFIIQNEFDAIIINKGRENREETLTKEDIVYRIAGIMKYIKEENLKCDLKMDKIEKILKVELS